MSRAIASSALALTAFHVLTVVTFSGQDRGQGRAGRGAAPANVLGDGPWDLDTEQARTRDVRVGPEGLIYLLTDETAGAVLKIEPRN